MRIGDLARLSGCKVVTVRYYEKEGLLKEPERTGNNYRVYSEADLERIRFIRNCRQHGMSLEEVRTLLAYSDNPVSDCAWVNTLIEKHIATVDRQIADLQHLRSHLAGLIGKCNGHASGNCGIIRGMRDIEKCSHCQHKKSENF